MNLTERAHSREHDREAADDVIKNLDCLVQAGQGVRHAVRVAEKAGPTDLQGWLAEMGRTDIWESLRANTWSTP